MSALNWALLCMLGLVFLFYVYFPLIVVSLVHGKTHLRNDALYMEYDHSPNFMTVAIHSMIVLYML